MHDGCFAHVCSHFGKQPFLVLGIDVLIMQDRGAMHPYARFHGKYSNVDRQRWDAVARDGSAALDFGLPSCSHSDGRMSRAFVHGSTQVMSPYLLQSTSHYSHFAGTESTC